MEHTRDHKTVTDAGDLLIIIPTRNDQESVGHVVQELHETFPSVTVLVVDRQSSDDTAVRAQAAGAVVVEAMSPSHAEAIHVGYQYAKDHGSYSVVVQSDARGCHPAHELGMLIDLVRQGADLVIGSRFQPAQKRMSLTERAAIKIFRFYTSLREGHTFSDPLSTMRATSSRLANYFAGSYPVHQAELDSLTFALRHGYTIKELPVMMLEQQSGQGRTERTGGSWKLLGHTLKCLLTLGPRNSGRA